MPTAPKRFIPAGQQTKRENTRLYDQMRDREQPWRAWYKSTRWRKASLAFIRANPLCADCDREGRFYLVTKSNPMVTDHIVPHKGNYELFWDVTNWQPLCKRHHDLKTRRGE